MEEKDQNGRNKRSGTRRTIQIILLVLAAAALIFLGRLAYVAFVDPLSAFDTPKAQAQTPAATPAPVSPQLGESEEDEDLDEPIQTLSPEELLQQQADLEFMKNKVNILMLGWDQSPEREEEGSDVYRDKDNNYRSDVIMLLSVDFETKKVDMISIPRDTYAPIYNTKGRWKINAAFAKGGSAQGDGFTYAMNTVGALLGVPIQYYAGVDMEGLKAVVDVMGGVDYDVDVEIRLNGRVLKKGEQHLNGQQVLDYCRARKGISTDIGRADRQQRMLFSIFSQLKQNGRLVDIPNMYAAVSDKVRTNLNLEQIAALSVFALSLDMENLNRHTLAGEYVSNVYNASFYVLSNKKLKALVKEVFGIQIKTNPKYDINYVKRDKAAAEAAEYITGAEHLLSVVKSAPGREDVLLALSQLYDETNIAVSAANMDEELLSDEDIDPKPLLEARDTLLQAMKNLCLYAGVTKQHVNTSLLPAALTSVLPEGVRAAAPYYAPAQEPSIEDDIFIEDDAA